MMDRRDAVLAGRAVGVGAENEDLVLELGISVPPSGTAVMSSGDWLMVMGSPRVSA